VLILLATGAGFGPVAVASALLGAGPWDFAAAVLGLAAFALLLRFGLPQHAAVALRMLGALLPASARAATPA
jgi:hypothetical protein